MRKAKRDSATLISTSGGRVWVVQEGKRRLSSSYILFGIMNNTALHLQHLPSWSASSKHLARMLTVILPSPLPPQERCLTQLVSLFEMGKNIPEYVCLFNLKEFLSVCFLSWECQALKHMSPWAVRRLGEKRTPRGKDRSEQAHSIRVWKSA